MTEIIKKLDLWLSNAAIVLQPVQNDAGSRFIVASLTENSKPYTIPESATVMLAVKKPDGTNTLTSATVTDNKVIAELTNQTLAVKGIADAQIIIYSGLSELKTPPFKLDILKQIVSEDTIESSDDFSALVELLNQYSIDSLIDTESVHPVQNKAISAEFAKHFEKTSTGKNLFNPDDKNIVVGKFFDNNGDLSNTNANFMTSGYMEVAEGQIYYASVTRNGNRLAYIRAYCYYDANKDVVSASGTSVTGGNLTIPTGVKYVRISTYSTAYGGSNYQFEAFMQTDYEPFKAIYDNLADVSIENNKAFFKSSSTHNWIETWLTGYVYDNTTHFIKQSPSYNSTLPLYIKGYDNFVVQYDASTETGMVFPYGVLFLDENKVVIAHYKKTGSAYPNTCLFTPKTNNAVTWTIPIPAGSVYAAISVENTKINVMAYAVKGANVRALPMPFENYSATYKIKPEIMPEIKYVKSAFDGKKLVALGDSITADVVLGLNAHLPFARIAASHLNMTFVNYGIGASEIAQHPENDNTYNPMCIRYADMDNDADLIIVAGGTNDWAHSHTPLGTMGDTSVNTFYGAMDTLCKGLLRKYPQKQIFFMTPIKRDRGDGTETGKEYFSPNTLGYTLKQFVDAIKEVCEFYGIPVLDMYANCSLNPIIPVIRSTYFANDGSHPNFAGHRIMARQVAGYITTLAKDIDYN